MKNFLINLKTIEDDVIQIQSRSMSDPTLSDIHFKNKMALVWTTLKIQKKSFSDNKSELYLKDFSAQSIHWSCLWATVVANVSEFC